MYETRFSREEIAQRGEELYERRIRSSVEAAFKGKIILMDIETGAYEIDETSLLAADRLRARLPEAVLYARRIGYDAVYALGGSLLRTKE